MHRRPYDGGKTVTNLHRPRAEDCGDGRLSAAGRAENASALRRRGGGLWRGRHRRRRAVLRRARRHSTRAGAIRPPLRPAAARRKITCGRRGANPSAGNAARPPQIGKKGAAAPNFARRPRFRSPRYIAKSRAAAARLSPQSGYNSTSCEQNREIPSPGKRFFTARITAFTFTASSLPT